MDNVSAFRLHLLRAAYLFIFVGLALMIWPTIPSARDAEHMRGVVRAMLTAVSLLALLGVRYPLQLLPLLLFELLWKTVWVLAIGVPLWSANAFTAPTAQTWNECMVGIVLVLLAIPWRYVHFNYVKRPGSAWKDLPKAVLAEAGSRR